MLGTIVNFAAIIVGSLIGLLLRGGLKENIRDILNQGTSLAVMFVGISGCVTNMQAEGANPVLFIVALALGGIIGEWVGIEAALARLGDWIQGKLSKGGGMGNFSKGFVSASLVVCVGTMAVMGAIESGVRGNHSILFAKSLLDAIITVVMASTLGIGVLFSGFSVLVYQGALTLLAVWVSPYLTGDMLREIGILGGIMITAIGTNMLGITKVRVGNLLPALLVPVAYYLITGLF
ncbi:DUF554 domain-containing protein [Ruminococcaceae bacterium OttesenSCG-928-D13]|nr:DUF554 domain-containing protein [Ruminococcaceae bacterium OttesenSCG-928-D13]